MENNKNKKSVKFQGDMLNFCDFIQVFVFTRNHYLNCSQLLISIKFLGTKTNEVKDFFLHAVFLLRAEQRQKRLDVTYVKCFSVF